MERPTVTTGIAAVAAIVIVSVSGALAEDKLRHTSASPDKDKAPPMRLIVVSIPDCKLALLEDGRIVRVWHTAVGAESTPSPSGTYTIINRVSQPNYYALGKVIPAGPANPVGSRWLGLSLKGFGIHGTNQPGSIGRKASHGCIRMRNQEIEELFEFVRVGDVVEIHRERNERLAEIFPAGHAPVSIPEGKAAPVMIMAAAH